MNTPQDPTSSESRPVVDEQRRRLTKGGLAAPVVLGTLLSRPVLGAPYHNCTISGKLSGNVSTHEQGTCAIGRSPGYWKHPFSPNYHTWNTWAPETQLFNSATADGASLPDAFPGKKVLEVLNMGGGNSASPYTALARAVIASVLNFGVHGTEYGIRAGEAIRMYKEVFSNGTYQAKPNVFWSADCCTAYLQTLYEYDSSEPHPSTIGCSGL